MSPEATKQETGGLHRWPGLAWVALVSGLGDLPPLETPGFPRYPAHPRAWWSSVRKERGSLGRLGKGSFSGGEPSISFCNLRDRSWLGDHAAQVSGLVERADSLV